MKPIRILRGGTTRAYSDLAFNSKGDKLASVGSDPDYMLTVWNWKAQEIILKSKAFSQKWGQMPVMQDVYKVAFAPENDGILTTSGMGHIKFWQMSATFTGLKLQGYLGKFGASELTDIGAFIQFPDGKVLSSTETGNMLLWDGGMIKCEIAMKGKLPCHNGRIEVVLLVDSEVYTAGEDGYVRVWDLEILDNADVSSDATGPGGAPVSSSGPAQARVFEMEFLEEFEIGKDVKVKSIVRSLENSALFLILDGEGNLFKLETKQRFVDKMLSFHSGAVLGASFSPTAHSLISIGADGGLHLYDYLNKSLVLREKYPAGGSALEFLPKTIDPLGCTVAAGFSDGVLRIISYQPLSPNFPSSVVQLQYAFKPHKCQISHIEISPDGTYMATCGLTDHTVFFFKIDKNSVDSVDTSKALFFSKKTISITPIGFIEHEEGIASISFSADSSSDQLEGDEEEADEDENSEEEGKFALIVSESGSIFTAVVPHPSKVNTQLTFQLSLSDLNIEPWRIVLPEVKQENAVASKEVGAETTNISENADGATEKTERVGSAIRKARGLGLTSSSPVSKVLCLSGGTFVMAILNKFCEGEIRLCKIDSPEISRLLMVANSKFTNFKISASGNFIIAGTVNGATCLRKIRKEDLILTNWTSGHEDYEHFSASIEETQRIKTDESDIIADVSQDERIGSLWMGHVHDCDRGKVTSVSISFDDAFFSSSGEDGGVFLFRYTCNEVEKQPEIEFEKLAEDASTLDIVDKSTYTIQDSKIKSERDREIAEAENTKQKTRDTISKLREDYLKILKESPQEHSQENLSVDPDLSNDIENETIQQIINVQKELEWISEKESIGPNKLRKKFLEIVQTPHIEIKSVKAASSVCTFRTTRLPEKSDLGITLLLNNDAPVSNRTQSLKAVESKQVNEEQEKGGKYKSASTKKNNKQESDTVSKLEARKALRKERAQKWHLLMDEKPDENYEDHQDVAAIKYAELHMGDYKLKTSEKYVVPESEHVDADKKKKQISMLKNSINGIKEQFNMQVVSLRDKKRDMIRYIEEKNRELLQLYKELSKLGDTKFIENYESWIPEMDKNCYPEEKFVVSEADVQSLKIEESLQNSKGHGGDFGDFGGGSKITPLNAVDLAVVSKKENRARSKTEISEMQYPVTGKSSLELMEEEILKKILRSKCQSILTKVDILVQEFDSSVDKLMHERIALAADMKLADMKLLLLYREWVHLKEFEKHDNFLVEKLSSKQSEKIEISGKLKECQERLNLKKTEVELIINQEKALQEEFLKTVSENNKFEDFLAKVFKKKIKRSKQFQKKNQAEGDEAEDGQEDCSDEDEDDTDDDEGFEDDGNESNDEQLDICPSELDQSVFNKILDLRENKLDLDDCLIEIQKAIEGLKKENDALIKKEKVIDSALQNSESEIQEFQTQKQRKLNELDVLVPLRQHQIFFFENNAFPTSLGQALVFVNNGLHKLKNRIKELQQEKSDIRKSHKELKKMHISLVKSRKEKQTKLSEFEGRAVDVQMLKFGQTIDLEKLEQMGINRNAEELQEKLQREDQKRLKEIETFERETRKQKDILIDMTRQNTILLENVVSLTEAHHSLEASLNQSQATVNAEYTGLHKKDILERNKLIELVQNQANEIDQLKKEIELLIRKPLKHPLTLPQNASKMSFHRASGVKVMQPDSQLAEKQSNNDLEEVESNAN
ncbi:Cilia- and flagella-associated protein 44 [Entophlyctis luteolus]|nr:Cilia- and flagella-associated protein 44 [Entophlyctis luteolus]